MTEETTAYEDLCAKAEDHRMYVELHLVDKPDFKKRIPARWGLIVTRNKIIIAAMKQDEPDSPSFDELAGIILDDLDRRGLFDE